VTSGSPSKALTASVNFSGRSDKGGSLRITFFGGSLGFVFRAFTPAPYRDSRVSCKEGMCSAIL
jgi:hypothetical protein